MTTAVSGAIKIVQSAPTPLGKIRGASLGLAIGAGAIGTKNILSNYSANPKKFSFTFVDLPNIINLTGNTTVDLLYV
jgi:hypothetical protein